MAASEQCDDEIKEYTQHDPPGCKLSEGYPFLPNPMQAHHPGSAAIGSGGTRNLIKGETMKVVFALLLVMLGVVEACAAGLTSSPRTKPEFFEIIRAGTDPSKTYLWLKPNRTDYLAEFWRRDKQSMAHDDSRCDAPE